MEQEIMNFDQFKTDWLNRHQASIPVEEIERSPYPTWARTAALAAFMTAALISGAHMIPTVYNGIPVSPIVPEWFRVLVSYGSFAAYELGMFMAAFLMAVEATKRLSSVMSLVIFTTLIFVNLNSVAEVYGLNLQENLVSAAVSLLFSLVPMIAYASGKFYINIGVAEAALVKRAKQAVKAESRELDAIINAAYTRYTKDFEKRQLELARERLGTHTDAVPGTNGYDTENGYDTGYVPGTVPSTNGTRNGVPSKAVRELADVLKDNPDDLRLSAGQIRQKYGKGQGVANDAKKLALLELEG